MLQDLLLEQPFYVICSIIVDFIDALIMAVIFITIIGLPKYMHWEIRRNFIAALLCGILTCSLDIWSYSLYGKKEHVAAFRIITEIDITVAIVFAMLCAALIIRYLMIYGKVSSVLRELIRYSYCLMILCNAIPPLQHLIFVPTENGELENGPLAAVYFIIMTLNAFMLAHLIIQNRRVLGTKFTILTVAMCVGPTLVILILGDEQPWMMLVTALFLMISYIIALQHFYYNMLKNEKLLAHKRVELSDLKTKIMLSQVKPHFVYNALSSIAYLCEENPKRAKELTLDFSRYLRGNLDTVGDTKLSIAPFSEELEHIRSYLNIELARFEERLRVQYDIRTDAFSVPVLSVQPLVENAVKHGICQKSEGGTVTISAAEDDTCYLVTVADDGVGFDPEKALKDGKNHIGISAVRKRLAMIGGTLEIRSVPDVGTTATVRIPKKR